MASLYTAVAASSASTKPIAAAAGGIKRLFSRRTPQFLPQSHPRLSLFARPQHLLRPNAPLSVRCFSALSPQLKSTLDTVVNSHKVLLFMKGTKDFPQCGFSNTVVQILKSCNVPFETINILENEALRQGLKDYSNWPTFPQLYINGEFFGGCDITVEISMGGFRNASVHIDYIRTAPTVNHLLGPLLIQKHTRMGNYRKCWRKRRVLDE